MPHHFVSVSASCMVLRLTFFVFLQEVHHPGVVCLEKMCETSERVRFVMHVGRLGNVFHSNVEQIRAAQCLSSDVLTLQSWHTTYSIGFLLSICSQR